MKKDEKSSSAGTKVDSSTNAEVEQVCQPIAKPNVMRRYNMNEDGRVCQVCYNRPATIKGKVCNWCDTTPLGKAILNGA